MAENKSRSFAMVLYPYEDYTHSIAIQKIFELYDYAYIEHNEDTYDEDGEEHKKGDKKKEHAHIVLKFENARHKSKIAKEIGIEENYIQKSNFVAYTRYLIHKDDPTKYQYDKKNIITNIPKEVESALNLKSDYKRHGTQMIIEYIEKNRLTSFYTLVIWAKNNGLLEEITKNAYLYKNMLTR